MGLEPEAEDVEVDWKGQRISACSVEAILSRPSSPGDLIRAIFFSENRLLQIKSEDLFARDSGSPKTPRKISAKKKRGSNSILAGWFLG
jgi:hypothetical protein